MEPLDAASPPEKRSVFLPLVLGGVIAAGLGFVASEMNLLGFRQSTTLVSDTISDQNARIVAQQEQITAQQDRIEALGSQIADLGTGAPATPVEAPDLSAISDTLASLQSRIDGLESRPQVEGADPAAVTQYSEELA